MMHLPHSGRSHHGRGHFHSQGAETFSCGLKLRCLSKFLHFIHPMQLSLAKLGAVTLALELEWLLLAKVQSGNSNQRPCNAGSSTCISQLDFVKRRKNESDFH